MKQIVATALKLNEATSATGSQEQTDEIKLQKEEINRVSTEQKKTAADQSKKDAELISREKAIAEKENQAEEKQKQLDMLQQKLQGQQTDYNNLVARFENMAPAKAAPAIAGMKSISDMVRLLSGMKSEKAALILENMDQKIATKILAEGLNQAVVTVPSTPSVSPGASPAPS
jgi:flagellar motility protein MotE (MotC chaperone)